MIKEKQKLTGNLNVKQSLSGKLGNAIICVDPITQEKEVMPTKEVQIIEPDKNYTGLSKVTVNPIPNEYIIPSGEIEFNQNGTYDVADKASAKVNIKEKVLGTKTITKNGTYKASDDDLDGYSEVEVETSGVDINDYYLTSGNKYYNKIYYYMKMIPLIDTSNVTNMNSMFSSCKELRNIPQLNTSAVTNMNSTFYDCGYLKTIPQLDTSSVTTMHDMFGFCPSLTTIPQLDTSNVTNMLQMFYNCSSLTMIPQLDLSKVTNVQKMFVWCFALTTLGGFQNLGMAYDTTASSNLNSYTLSLSDSSKLTHDSLMNVINNLYDIANKGCNAQQLILGSVNLAKLTAEEIAIATDKGWTVS